MKKLALLTISLTTFGLALAVPTYSFDPTSIDSSSSTVNLNYQNDSAINSKASGLKFDLDIPAGVTISSVTASDPLKFRCNNTGNSFVIDGVDLGGSNPLPASATACVIEFDLGTVTSGTIRPTITSEEYSDASDNAVLGVVSSLSDITIGGGTTDFNVTVDTNAGGSVSCNPLTGPANTSVTCTATPDANFVADAWTGACAQGSGATINGDKCTFSLTADTNVGATFKAATAQTFNVSVTQTTGGTVACNPTSGATGDTISCTATADKGYTVASWNNAECSGQGATCTFTLGSANVSGVSATFNRTAPIRQGVSKPVPVLGLFGLFGLLASVFGAAAMVLRRK